MPARRALGCFLALLLLDHTATAGTPSPSEAAKRSAEEMYQAFRRGDLEAFAKFTHPKVIAMMGGTQPMIAVIEKEMASAHKEGFSVLSVAVAAPVQMVKAGSEPHAILPMKMVLKAPGGELRRNRTCSESHLTRARLGLSSTRRSWMRRWSSASSQTSIHSSSSRPRPRRCSWRSSNFCRASSENKACPCLAVPRKMRYSRELCTISHLRR
jgi:hypothetical protein